MSVLEGTGVRVELHHSLGACWKRVQAPASAQELRTQPRYPAITSREPPLPPHQGTGLAGCQPVPCDATVSRLVGRVRHWPALGQRRRGGQLGGQSQGARRPRTLQQCSLAPPALHGGTSVPPAQCPKNSAGNNTSITGRAARR
jgi:hypothetical protein